MVAFQHRGAALAVALLDGRLDRGDRLVVGEEVGEREEARLEHRVDPVAESVGPRHRAGVDDPDPEVLVDDGLLRLPGQVVPDLIGRVRGVDQKGRAVAGDRQQVAPVERTEVVDGHEVGFLHEMGGPDRLRPETEVGRRGGSRLLRVVDEVALGEQRREVADDLHRVLVGADRAVAAQPVEDGPAHRRGFVPGIGVVHDMGVADVVDDADRDLVAGKVGLELGEHGHRHRRGELLRRQPVAPADHLRHGTVGPPAGQPGDDVEVERLADGTGLLGAIEGGDALDGGRERVDQCTGVERAVEPHRHHADALAGRHEGVDRFAHGPRARTHDHHDPGRLGMTVVVEDPVATPGQLGEAVHLLLDDAGHGVVVGVGRLGGLEEDVGVLSCSPDDGTVGVERPPTVPLHELVVDHLPDGGVVDLLDLGDLVTGPEPVEEVQEGDASPQCRCVADKGEVVRLLDRPGGEHGHAGLAGRHHVAVITEDAEGVGRDRPGGDVDDHRKELAGDLVEIGDHQQQALRRGERGGQRARLERAVHCAGRPCLALHLDHVGHRAPQVLDPGLRPGVGMLAHRRRRGDGVDRDHLADAMGDTRRGLVAVDRDVPGVSHASHLRTFDPGARRCGSLHWVRTARKDPP